MEHLQFVSPLRQCCSTPVGFGQGFLSKEQCDNTGSSPILCRPACSRRLLVPSTEICIKWTALLWCYWHHWEWDGGAEKIFTKWLPELFPAPLESLAEVCRCTRGLFWRKCILWLYSFVFLRNKMFPGTFWTYHVCMCVYVCRIYIYICRVFHDFRA